MVTSVTSSASSTSNWVDSVFSKLDTKNQGYIDKTDLQSALSAAGDSSSGGSSSDVDDAFSALDSDGDGKITKSELSSAVDKLSAQLSTQRYTPEFKEEAVRQVVERAAVAKLHGGSLVLADNHPGLKATLGLPPPGGSAGEGNATSAVPAM